MNYVAHDCRNTRNGTCDNRWVDKDLTRAKDRPPTWKYCEECCEKLGIDFNSQTPSQGISEKEKGRRKMLAENAKSKVKQNIKSVCIEKG